MAVALLDSEPDSVAEDHRPRPLAEDALGSLAQPLERFLDLRRLAAEERAWATDALGEADDPGGVRLVEAVADDFSGEAEASAVADAFEVALLRPSGRARLQLEPRSGRPPRLEVGGEGVIDFRVDDRRHVVVVGGEDATAPEDAGGPASTGAGSIQWNACAQVTRSAEPSSRPVSAANAST